MSYVDSAFKSPVVLSLCPGIRGLERGIERALGTRVRVAAYVEIEAFIVANLLAGMEEGILDATPIWSNLKTFDAGPFHGKIHGILGGYPCQPFSAAGLRKGTTDPRHLYPFISRCIKKSRPLWCLFENVEGHLSLGFDIVQKDLRKMGYSVEAGIYSAAEAGAPHRRNRLFILAMENTFRERMRGRVFARNSRCGSGCEIQTTGPGELGNASIEYVGTQARQYGQVESGRSSIMADTRHPGYGLGTDGKHKGHQSQEGTKEFPSSNTLADSNQNTRGIPDEGRGENIETNRSCEAVGNFRQHGRVSGICKECGREWSVGSNGPVDPTDHSQRWPSRPGEQQQEWEEPRIIKPGMGCTVNGYNFREDFLRALGNSVVEQTAEIAFIDLLRKHGITLI